MEPVPSGVHYDLWLGPAPSRPYNANRVHYTFRFFWDYSGGQMTNWGAHHLDIAQWGLGMDDSGPVEIWTEGSKFNPPTYTEPESRARGDKLCSVPMIFYRYANGVVVKLDDAPQGGAIFVGQEGKITVACGIAKYDPLELGRGAPANLDNFLGHKGPLHTQQWLKCLRTRERPSCDFEIGHRTATAAHVGNIARWRGRKLRWDPAEEEFRGDDQANALLSRPMRTP